MKSSVRSLNLWKDLYDIMLHCTSYIIHTCIIRFWQTQYEWSQEYVVDENHQSYILYPHPLAKCHHLYFAQVITDFINTVYWDKTWFNTPCGCMYIWSFALSIYLIVTIQKYVAKPIGIWCCLYFLSSQSHQFS